MAQPLDVHLGLTPKQTILFNCVSRFLVLVCGRRFGKTYLALIKLFVVASRNPGAKCWYVAPTRVDAKDIAWEMLKDLIPERARWRTSESTLTIWLTNRARISLQGAENFQRLRGRGLRFVVIDEFSDMDPRTWYTSIRPSLSDIGFEGGAWILGSPRGFDHLKKIYDSAVDGKKNWTAFHYTTAEGGNVDPQEIEDSKEDMSERDWRQEWFATFETISGRVYHEFKRAQWPDGNLDKEIVDLGGPLYVGMDFNVNPMTATLSSENVVAKAGGSIVTEPWTWGEIVIPDSNTTTMMQELRRRYPERQLVVYPDPSANRRQTNAPVGVTDVSIIKSFGATCYIPTTKYGLHDRYNTTNGLMRNALGVRRKRINPKTCPTLVESYDGFQYKEGTNLPDKGAGFDHITDADGYMHMALFPMKRAGALTVSSALI